MVKLEATSQNIKEGMESAMQSTWVRSSCSGWGSVLTCHGPVRGGYWFITLHYSWSVGFMNSTYWVLFLTFQNIKRVDSTAWLLSNSYPCQEGAVNIDKWIWGLAATRQGRNSCHRELEVQIQKLVYVCMHVCMVHACQDKGIKQQWVVVFIPGMSSPGNSLCLLYNLYVFAFDLSVL